MAIRKPAVKSGEVLGEIPPGDYYHTTPNVAQSTPANPTGTRNTTGVMMGLGVLITPRFSGILAIHVSGDITNNSNANGASVQIRTGTGSAPANGDALKGTARGGKVRFDPNLLAVILFTEVDPFGLNWFTPLGSPFEIGTQIWIDLALAAIGGGTASLGNLSISVMEL
jgi:hypothetical protein